MDNNTKNIGDLGENIACGYLLKNGYKLVDKNYREKWGEIDIIAINTSKILVFVEVKTLNFKGDTDVDNSELLGIIPEDHFNNTKRNKVINMSKYYINKNPHITEKCKGWQVDLIAVYLKDKKLVKINHYENVLVDY